LNESILGLDKVKFDPAFWMLEPLPEPNSFTLKMEQPVPLKRLKKHIIQHGVKTQNTVIIAPLHSLK
jgi:hypothetical protein